MGNPENRWWPNIEDQQGAKKAAHEGAGAAVFVMAVTLLFSVLAMFSVQILPGPKFSAWSLGDAGLFAIAAWRIYKMSRAWAVVGLLLFLYERVYAFYVRPTATAGIIVGLIVLLAFVNGVRGTFAHHRLSKVHATAVEVKQAV